jgi:PAS domain S-box-containing protein
MHELEELTKQRTRQLEEQRSFATAIINTSSALILVLDSAGRIVRFNRTCERITGYACDEVREHYLWEVLLTVEDTETVKQAFEQVKREHTPQNYETAWRARDGSLRHITWSNTAILDEQGTFEYLIGTGIDITEQKQVEASLLRRDAILEAVSFAAEQFLKTTSLEDSIQKVLERLGKATEVSRVYIFENELLDGDMLACNQQYEWVAEGVAPQIDNPDLQGVPYREAGLERWSTTLERGSPLYGNVRTFPEGERAVLEPQEIKSIVVVPIFIGQQWWGFIGFDDCVREYPWSTPEIETLKAAAGTMGAAIQRDRVQAALRENEERYRGLIESQIDLIVRVDAEGRFTFVNDVYCKTFGKTRAELLGNTFMPLVHEDDLKTTVEAMKGLEVPPYRIYIEQRALTANGWRWLAWEDYAIKDENGNTVEIQAIGRDITDRKHTEEALRQSEAHYRAIVEDQTELIARYCPDGTFTFVNEAYCRYFGTPRNEIIGHTFEPDIPAEDRARITDAIFALGPHNPVATFENRVILPDGTTRWQQWTNRVILDKQNAIIEFQAVGRDITERVEAQEMLVRISTAVESTSDAVSIGDMNARALYHNKAFVELYGYTAEEMNEAGGPVTMFTDPALAQQVIDAAIQGVSWNGTVDFRTRDGHIIPTLLRADCILDGSGHQIGLVAVCTDITMQKKAEQELIAARETALEASRLKSEFLANMSHEIRTPLNAIIGMTGLLLETDLDLEQQEFSETIRNSGDALLTVINDILDFSKIEAGKLELEYQPLDVRSCIEESLDLVVPQAAEKRLDLAYTIDENTPTIIVGDITRLRQVLINLLSNAVKFTEAGEVVISVESNEFCCPIHNENGHEQEHDTGIERPFAPPVDTHAPMLYELHFAVRDTGIGIPQSRMSRLFQSFSQVDSSITRKHGGTGLGLAISKALIEAMGGSMWVESEEGQGSTFHFTIVARSAPARPLVFMNTNQPLLADKRVLIVDDNKTNRRILSRQLQSWGMHTRDTASGDEALQWLRWGEPFDIAILDMHMPDIDGLTLAAEIRTHRSASALPLMMLSSVGDIYGPEYEEVGFAASLSKPVKPSHLYNVLLNIFAGTMLDPDELAIHCPIDEQKPGSHSLRILIAEDHAVNQKVALRLLKRLGYRADVAANGLEVMEALQRQPYDVVLMDVQMPEMDGVETTRRIRSQLPLERQPRIIAVTAHALKGSRERYLAAGMDHYISKPVRLEELAAVLSTYQSLIDHESQHKLLLEHDSQSEPGVTHPEASGDQANKGDGEGEGWEERLQAQHVSAALPPAIDEKIIQEMTEGADEEDLEEMCDILILFLESTPDLLAALHEALEQADPLKLRQAAHTMKSSSQMGAIHLSLLAAQLQDIGDSGTVAGAAPLVAQADAEYRRVKLTLEAIIQGLQARTI